MDILDRKPYNHAIHTSPSNDLRLVESTIPEIQPHECLVHVRATGICGSDVHFWKHGYIGDMIVSGDNGLGHESAGVVLKVGKDVTRFKPIALECSIPCSKPTCYFCRTGQYNACPDGAWLRHIPDTISFKEGALLEPLTVGLAGIDRSGLRLADLLVICGAVPHRPSDLTSRQRSRRRANRYHRPRRNTPSTKELIPRVRPVQASRDETAKAFAGRIVETLGQEAKLVIECTGVESSIHAGIYSTRFGGSVFVTGVGNDFQSFPFMHLSSREIDLRFQYRYHDVYPKAISLVAAGIIDLKPSVSHRFALEDGFKAFETASNPPSRAIKVQILDD
ncbi:chaperonin 10-like protein [Aspergillus alliaceus]|uniref:chaperonin 10-like protein n=1 Tax=Petromyces alliaceus TaxID=209559 RepID=UPI0012A57689|nr:chaperonin 10-like protein [Aspergillus alliaceus]KAB8232065.1 chaperonin 10-like protein [Aspergillus alliaceus]